MNEDIETPDEVLDPEDWDALMDAREDIINEMDANWDYSKATIMRDY